MWREFACPHRGEVLLLLLAVVGTSLLNVAVAPITGAVIDVVNCGGSGALGRLDRLSLLLLVVTLGWAGMSVLQRWASVRLGQSLILDLRRALYDHVQRMPLAFFTRLGLARRPSSAWSRASTT